MINNEVFIGTELKLNVNINPFGTVTMDDYDFIVEISTQRTSCEFKKSQLLRQDENNYVVLLDSKKLGLGVLKCKVTAYVPDTDFPDGIRTEVLSIDTGIIIRRG